VDVVVVVVAVERVSTLCFLLEEFVFPTFFSRQALTETLNLEKTRTATQDISNLARTKISRERPLNLSRSLSLSLILAHENRSREENAEEETYLSLSLSYSLSIAKVFSLVRERKRVKKKFFSFARVTPLFTFPEEEDNDQI